MSSIPLYTVLALTPTLSAATPPTGYNLLTVTYRQKPGSVEPPKQNIAMLVKAIDCSVSPVILQPVIANALEAAQQNILSNWTKTRAPSQILGIGFAETDFDAAAVASYATLERASGRLTTEQLDSYLPTLVPSLTKLLTDEGHDPASITIKRTNIINHLSKYASPSYRPASAVITRLVDIMSAIVIEDDTVGLKILNKLINQASTASDNDNV